MTNSAPDSTPTAPADQLASLPPERRALLAHLLRRRDGEHGGAPAAGDPASGAQAAESATRHSSADRHEPFPLTDLQQAYWMGRSSVFDLGNLASRAYLEIECEHFDHPRFEQAWARLVSRHDMLRVVVRDDGQQQVIEDVPDQAIPTIDLTTMTEAEAERRRALLRREMLDDLRPTDQFPLCDVRLSIAAGDVARVHLTIDLLVADAGSIALLFRDLAALYHRDGGELPRVESTFRDFVLALGQAGESDQYQRARAYWLARVPDFPPGPALPLATDPSAIAAPRSVRRVGGLDEQATSALKARASRAGLTTSSVLLAAYAEVLAHWSTSPRLSINIPLFNRPPLVPGIEGVVGAFTSVELLTVDHSQPGSFAERAQRLQEQLLDDLEHRAFDGVSVMREIARAGGNASMPVVFTSLVDVGYNDAVSGFGRIVNAINQTAQVWMDLHVDESDGRFVFKWDAVDELFPDGMPADMLAAYCSLLDGLATGDAAWHEPRRALLPPAQVERRQAMNATDGPVPGGLIHTHFAAQAAGHPDAIAVIADGRTLTHGELLRTSTRIGRHLRALGARPNRLVAIAMEKGWEQVAAAFGVLQSGAAYLPIDPDSPKERFWHLLAQGEVELVLTQSHLDARLDWPEHVRRLSVDSDLWELIDDSPLEPVQEPADLAYVLFTSGSTGQPKGVMIEHRSVLNRMLDVNRRFGIEARDRALALTALHHDLSIYDLFGVLLAGGSLVIPSSEMRREPGHWLELLREHDVTVWNSVPAFAEMFVEYVEHADPEALADSSLRFIIMSGDWIPVRLPDRLRALLPALTVIGAGGPTETTVWDICFPIDRVEPEWKSIPYERPMTNARYHVLNEALEPCPDWVTGELYIGGSGLARGYWGDEELTSARFLTHPDSGERLYRSGDTGRLKHDGTIEFMGRADFQVKIQGQRIELGEIEVTLGEHPAVRAAVATAFGEPQGRKRLVAYFVPNEEHAASPEALRAHLQAKIPGHMVPTAIVPLDELPLTQNGKVDRRALRDPGETAEAATAAPAPGSSARIATVAAIVADVLGVNAPDPLANIVSLGASSIEMVSIANRLEKEFGSRLTMDQLFRLQTISELAGHYDVESLPGAQDSMSSAATGVDPRLDAYRVMIDPAEVEAFKKTLPGIRSDSPDRGVAFPATTPEVQPRLERHSHRQFALRPIPLEAFARFLGQLRPIELDGTLKYLYGSPGGVYSVQAYLHVKPGRVEGVGGGTYYYHPLEHRLVELVPGAVIDRDIHIPFINQPTFDEAAFSLLLITRLDAIGPVYGQHSLRFSTIEAGLIAQLLETVAPQCELGLCQIGSIDFDQIRDLFALDDSHVLVHSLLGGAVDANGEAAQARNGSEEAKIAGAVERIRDLSPEQVRALLDANRAAQSESRDE